MKPLSIAEYLGIPENSLTAEALNLGKGRNIYMLVSSSISSYTAFLEIAIPPDFISLKILFTEVGLVTLASSLLTM
ncbi:hypothetical protein R80B4_01730 [Fibrobacteres bacterium R8-0-B4]